MNSLSKGLKMFEVGKKYTYREKLASGIVIVLECIFADNKIALLKYEKGASGYIHLYQVKDSHSRYIEYHEPKIDKIVRHVCVGSSGHGSEYFTLPYISPVLDLVGSMELIITDGVLTSARVIPKTNS